MMEFRDIKFNHYDNNGKVLFHRTDAPGYLHGMLKRAMRSGATIEIRYTDGSKTVINPEEK